MWIIIEVSTMKIIDKLGWEVVILFVTGIGFIGFSWGVGEWFKKDALIWSYIVIVCALFWRKMEKKIREYKFEDNFYPTMMVAQGTYYTFIGISAILITFGTNNNGNQFVEVKELLAGLRLAFITSAIGLISSIAAKMYMKKKATEYLESAPYQEYVLLEDDQMYRALIEMKNSLSNQGDMLKEVQYDLVNESQKSIIKSVEKLTDNIGEIIEKRITEAIDKNAQAVNETIRSNSDMFIAALAQCNAKFMSSFEEYRVALNLAKDTIGVISGQATDVNKQLKDSMDKINESVDRTDMTVSGLSTTLETIRNQYEASDKWFAETFSSV